MPEAVANDGYGGLFRLLPLPLPTAVAPRCSSRLPTLLDTSCRQAPRRDAPPAARSTGGIKTDGMRKVDDDSTSWKGRNAESLLTYLITYLLTYLLTYLRGSQVWGRQAVAWRTAAAC